MSSFKISFIQQSILLFHLIFTITVLLIAFYYIFGTIFPVNGFIFLYVFLFLFEVFPTFFLHIQYLIKNRGAVLNIYPELKRLSYAQSNIVFQHSFNEIKIIEAVASYGKGSGWYSFEEYRYCKIVFNDTSTIIVTCIMVNDIENTLERLLNRKVEKKFKFLAIIPSSRSRLESPRKAE